MEVQSHETTGPNNERGLLPFDAGKDSCGVSFVADIKNRKTHKVVQQGLTALERLTHRGATGCEENTGDGAGVLTQLPDKFLRKAAKAAGLSELPAPGAYGVGMIFLPQDAQGQATVKASLEKLIKEEGQGLLGWRPVPVDHSMIGPTALKAEPAMAQLFIARASGLDDQDSFERKLYLIRKRCEGEILASSLKDRKLFYVASMSSRTIVYKGMLTPEQVRPYFPDLADPDFESALCISHSRFSTNTFPSWDLAHPFRYLAHNGEINTLRGNANWMHARQALFQSKYFPGPDIKRLLPIITEGGSDSAALDNALELLVMAGRSLPHAMMMLIPEAWSGHKSMSQAKKDFYRYHASLMEPWDGPADVVFSDGRVIGGVLDRNGLRPSRISITADGTVILASETGVLNDIAPGDIVQKTRLEPGRMFLVDLEKGVVVNDEALKDGMAKAEPYGDWLSKKLLTLKDLPEAGHVPGPDHDTLLHRQVAFGYTHEDLKMVMAPMALDGMEAIGSMGDDVPLAVLSDKPQLLFSYFKQLFAQVTNPPLDAIREELVTSVVTTIGPEGDLLNPTAENCRQIELQSPILSNDELSRFKQAEKVGFKAVTLPMLFPASSGGAGVEKALDELFKAASQAVDKGAQILILSDRGIDAHSAPIPSLLATAGLHHHLIREGKRTKVGLIIESGEPREVHHFSLLIGYGANAINPYVAFETVEDLSIRGILPETLDLPKAQYHFIKAANKGIVKIMSKMGISTIQSYRGAQIFEAIGLSQALIDRYFTWTASRIQGIGLEEIAKETGLRHELAFSARTSAHLDLDWGGKYKWRREGEHHMMDATAVAQLQHAAFSGDYKAFKHYSHRVNDQAHRLLTLRGLLRFKAGRKAIPLEEVEPVAEILKRFTTGAMSYGSISQEAHETLAIAMNRIGGKSNTGEGGEDEERFATLPNGDSKRSAIKQVASGRFGVTSHYLVNARQIQIKMAQGAKPGEGGQLPAKKVWPWIAKTRHSTPFVGLISPPPHHDIYSIEDLAQLIHDLKNANKDAAISVKLVSEVGVGTVAAGVAKAKADHILISGHDGGTGASPLTSLKYAGIPWELGLTETHQTLVMNGLRDRVKVETDGQLRTGRDVVMAALLGAEEYGFATVALVTTGCIMMRVCHLDTCPAGVATQNPELRKKFIGKPEYVVNFMTFVATEVREIMAELGFRSVAEMVGHTELLEVNPDIKHWKANKLDLGPLIRRVEEPYGGALTKTKPQDHGLAKALDNQILADAKEALEKGAAVKLSYRIENVNRTVGTLLGAEISRRHGSKGLPDNSIQLDFKGTAGQSFGAFVPRGVTLRLEGDANDYVGKGLCGGRIIVVPDAQAPFRPEDNIIVGNTLFYGATAGEGFIRGRAGERFCVRNSGVNAVVEGLGDHGCEYMTGGRIVVLGPTGRNFAAGMSGGIAYVFDEDGGFSARCNMELVELEDLAPDDEELVKELLRKHHLHTGSSVAEKVLENWRENRRRLVKVIPSEYKKALQAQAEVAAETVAG
jgi:glutamate synthase (NADPH/NADH) large chain